VLGLGAAAGTNLGPGNGSVPSTVMERVESSAVSTEGSSAMWRCLRRRRRAQGSSFFFEKRIIGLMRRAAYLKPARASAP
jgi:hypothetical protein